jgi:hypothetical protein
MTSVGRALWVESVSKTLIRTVRMSARGRGRLLSVLSEQGQCRPWNSRQTREQTTIVGIEASNVHRGKSQNGGTLL